MFTRDDDLELVGQAIPFGLKLYESLLDSAPKNKDLLIATCSNFTQYGVAYLETEATVLGEAKHHDEVAHLNARALKLYLRARGYCLRAMEVRFPGIGPKLSDGSGPAPREGEKKDVPLLYWMAASWGSAIAPRPRQAGPRDRHAGRPGAGRTRARARRDAGARARCTRCSSPSTACPKRSAARRRARANTSSAPSSCSRACRPGPYVALATGVACRRRIARNFEKLLKQALAIDPEKDPSMRLVTLVQQRRARALLDHIDTMFTK